MGMAANQEDFNLMLVIENENMAALDPIEPKKLKWMKSRKKLAII